MWKLVDEMLRASRCGCGSCALEALLKQRSRSPSSPPSPGMGDRSFNDMMDQGMKRAVKELGYRLRDHPAAQHLGIPAVARARGRAGLRHHHRIVVRHDQADAGGRGGLPATRSSASSTSVPTRSRRTSSPA